MKRGNWLVAFQKQLKRTFHIKREATPETHSIVWSCKEEEVEEEEEEKVVIVVVVVVGEEDLRE